MDHKAWLWRKKSSEKTIVATGKVDVSLKRIDEEVQTLPEEKEVGPERSVKNLNQKLASVLFDCHATDDVVAKHAKMAQEAIAGQEKAEAEAVYLKKELNEALRQGVTANKELTHSDAALKECMQQLSFVREEQEQRIHDAVMKSTREFEMVQKKLEDKLTETNKRLAQLAVENDHLSKALLVKEQSIEDLHKHKSHAEAEFNVILARLDSTEKENAFLKYEFHILEKELEIRNEEMEYNRRSADASHKQHLESVKKIAKLEAECQRVRLLLRKRLPGPAALVKMRSEVEILGRDQTEMRRRKMNSTRDLIVRDSTTENSPENPSKKISALIERLCDMEEENKTLKEVMTKKNAELHSSRLMYSRTASRLSHVETQLKEICKGQKSVELARCSPISNELSLISSFDIGSDDGISSSGSWANALMLELEHFRDGKLKNQLENKAIEVSDMCLMDDFVEMERLAIVSVETPSGDGFHPELTGKELVPVAQGQSSFGDTKQDINSKDVATEKSFDWLQVVLNAISEQKRISKRSLAELLEDIRIALGCINRPISHEADTTTISRHSGEPDLLPECGYISWKSPNTSPVVDLSNGASSIDTSAEQTSNQHIQSNLSESICKIIELIKGINITSLVGCDSPTDWSERNQSSLEVVPPSDYFVRVFQWKSSELSSVLQQFVRSCDDLLLGKADFEKFAVELSFALDWIMNNYVTPKDASSTRDKIKKHFGWNESKSVDEVDGLLVKSERVHIPNEQSCLHSPASTHDQSAPFQRESIQCNLQEENNRLKEELKNMEARLESATNNSKALMLQLQESEQSIGSLQTELKNFNKSKEMIEDQIENQKSINEDLDTQLTVAKAKLNEVFQKMSSLEVELEYKHSCCEELEAACLELQLQLESVVKKEIPKYHINKEGKQSQNGWEIAAASVKLAECQETILNLGKQIKALASPHEAALFDKVFPTTGTATTATNNKKLNKRSSLRDQMLAEDDSKAEVLKSPKTKGSFSAEGEQKPSLPHSNNCNALHDPNILVNTPEEYLGLKNKANNTALAIVPSKKQGRVGLLRKLLLRRKKGSSKRTPSLAKV